MSDEHLTGANGKLFDQLMNMAGEVHRDLYIGKKVVVHGKQWIVLFQFRPTLFLAVESGATPPCDVKLIRAERQDFA